MQYSTGKIPSIFASLSKHLACEQAPAERAKKELAECEVASFFLPLSLRPILNRKPVHRLANIVKSNDLFEMAIGNEVRFEERISSVRFSNLSIYVFFLAKCRARVFCLRSAKPRGDWGVVKLSAKFPCARNPASHTGWLIKKVIDSSRRSEGPKL